MEESGEKWWNDRMLIGQYAVNVGEKNRIAFPKKFREVLGNKLIITYGFESSLIVVSEVNWKSLLQGSEKKPFLLSTARDTQRFLLGGASLVDLDAQGRFVLPDYLKEFSDIREEVVFMGLNSYVEMWDKKRWIEYQKNMQKNISETADKLVERIGDKSS